MITVDITTAIETQAAASAATLREQGWTGDGAAYDIGVYTGDLEALEATIGRPAVRSEVLTLEAAIRRALRP